jgi:hypothetical protein
MENKMVIKGSLLARYATWLHKHFIEITGYSRETAEVTVRLFDEPGYVISA